MSNATDQVAHDQLRSFVERVERLEEEIKAMNEDKADVYQEAKSNGFDVKVLKRVISERRRDPSERQEADAIFEIYWEAVGGAVGTVRATRVHAGEAAH